MYTALVVFGTAALLLGLGLLLVREKLIDIAKFGAVLFCITLMASCALFFLKKSFIPGLKMCIPPFL